MFVVVFVSCVFVGVTPIGICLFNYLTLWLNKINKFGFPLNPRGVFLVRNLTQLRNYTCMSIILFVMHDNVLIPTSPSRD